MRDLPIEIWQKIMSELEVEDLVNCTKVCSQWYNIVNSDVLWKPICLKKNWLKVHQDISCRSTSGCGKDDTCNWRTIFNENEKLYSRWRSGGWTRHSLASRGHQGDIFSLSSDAKSLAVGYQNGTVLIWNICTKPLIRATIKGILPNYPILEIKISQPWVAIVQDRLVQIFKSDAEETALNRVICLDLGPGYSDLTSSWTSLPYFHSWYRECLRVNEIKTSKRLLTALGGSHLLVTSGEDGSLHTWTLLSAGQSKQFNIQGKVKELISWEQSVYIVGWERRSSKIYEYLGTEGSLDQVVKSPGACTIVLSSSYIVTVPVEGGFTLQKLRTWCRGTGECIGSRTLACASTQACVTDSNTVIFTEDSTINVWNPVKDSILLRISVEGNFPVNFIDARFSDFLVVLLDNSVCVYNWKNGRKLYSINSQLEWSDDYVNMVWIGPTAIVVGGIYNKPELLSFV